MVGPLFSDPAHARALVHWTVSFFFLFFFNVDLKIPFVRYFVEL